MISRSDILGNKLIVLREGVCHVYNPEAKDHVEAKCPSEKLV